MIENHTTDGFVAAFHFKVTFLAANPDASENNLFNMAFSEVSGLSSELQTEDVVCAGENRYVYHLPKPAKTKNLVLKRAYSTRSSDLVTWAENAIYNFKFRLCDIIVELMDEKHETVKSWYFCDAYPVKLNYTNLKADANEILIETLELAYKYTKSK